MPELLIMNCPYCGSHDVHVLEEQGPSNGYHEERVVITCLSCNEDCCITRLVDEDDDESWADPYPPAEGQ